ncbi:hypothetical protein E1289_32930 [Actinomadura sp. 6K520]|nr:hypothetical protein E1289_32930 [Actinomadura sp. 6K520]
MAEARWPAQTAQVEVASAGIGGDHAGEPLNPHARAALAAARVPRPAVPPQLVRTL